MTVENGYKLLSLTGTDLRHLEYTELWNHCDQLEVIHLLHNRLESLPPSLQDHYSTLEVATLSYNSFEQIPMVIFSLQKLTNLNMMYNSISVVPQKISRLQHLTNLYLSHNNIFSLPDAFSSCNQLSVLCLDNNQLSHIPDSIRTLSNLQTLELHHNNLQHFQLSEKDFKNLKVLLLHHNCIQVLPKPFQRLLGRLDNCSLYANPFHDPLLCEKLLKLKNCARNYKEIGKECVKFSPRKGFRVLVIGGCGSGKTSIVQVLCKDKYVTPVEKDEHNHTIGIEQHVHHFVSRGSTYELTMWDFAGEDSYLMMNYMFFSEGTLVWLVFNLAEYQAELQRYNKMIGVWLRAAIASVRNPSIWIIGTHSDRCSKREVKERTNSIYNFVAEECDSIKLVNEKDLVSEIIGPITDNEISFHSEFVRVFPVSNTYERDGYDRLCEEIEKLPLSGTSSLLESLPTHWQHVCLYLRERSRKHFVEDQGQLVQALCDEGLTSSSEEAEEILKYLHEVGDVLRISIWQSKKKVTNVFLDIKRLIYVLKQIFRHNLLEKINSKLDISRDYDHRSQSDALQLVSEHGIIPEDIIMKLWSPIGISKRDMLLLIDLLIKFKIAYQVIQDDVTCYLFPFLLNDCSSLPYMREVHSKQITIQCDFRFMPCGLFERLLCCCSPYFAKGYTIHRNLLEGVFVNDKNLKLRIFSVRNPSTNYGGQIEIHVEEASSINSSKDYLSLWQPVIGVIHKLKQLVSEWPKLRVSMVVVCPRCPNNQHTFPLVIPPKSPLSVDLKCEHGDIHMESVIPPSSKS